jgi:hypothetical protein
MTGHRDTPVVLSVSNVYAKGVGVSVFFEVNRDRKTVDGERIGVAANQGVTVLVASSLLRVGSSSKD